MHSIPIGFVSEVGARGGGLGGRILQLVLRDGRTVLVEDRRSGRRIIGAPVSSIMRKCSNYSFETISNIFSRPPLQYLSSAAAVASTVSAAPSILQGAEQRRPRR